MMTAAHVPRLWQPPNEKVQYELTLKVQRSCRTSNDPSQEHNLRSRDPLSHALTAPFDSPRAVAARRATSSIAPDFQCCRYVSERRTPAHTGLAQRPITVLREARWGMCEMRLERRAAPTNREERREEAVCLT